MLIPSTFNSKRVPSYYFHIQSAKHIVSVRYFSTSPVNVVTFRQSLLFNQQVLHFQLFYLFSIINQHTIGSLPGISSVNVS